MAAVRIEVTAGGRVVHVGAGFCACTLVLLVRMLEPAPVIDGGINPKPIDES